MEEILPPRRNPKKVDGVHFVWVQKYRWSSLPEHWLSISHPSVVRVFEPRKEYGHKPKHWTVVLYKPGVFPVNNSIEYCAENFHGPKKKAWAKAAKMAKCKLELPEKKKK
jgi:hypothetical protein